LRRGEWRGDEKQRDERERGDDESAGAPHAGGRATAGDCRRELYELSRWHEIASRKSAVAVKFSATEMRVDFAATVLASARARLMRNAARLRSR
jgi:hypothetical protein